ncbi:MAG TPA: class I SAM-dependent methyltransferase [Myxococcota bacterium]|nr:class I SAM-dependent methyltransferase [Myxococcota bacterium]
MGWLYDFYERRVFPRLMDLTMRGMNELRGDALAGAHGDVLEIGFGTGLNLRHYPPAVTRLTGIDPMEAPPKKVQERVAAAAFPVAIHQLRADGRLPFDDARFDSAAVTWTLCTIPDPIAALREVRRVLKPGASLHFIEHGRSDDPSVARWQDRWNPIQNVIGCGCNVNRRIDEIVKGAGFRLEKLDRFVPDHVPRLFGEMYRGVGVSS